MLPSFGLAGDTRESSELWCCGCDARGALHDHLAGCRDSGTSDGSPAGNAAVCASDSGSLCQKPRSAGLRSLTPARCHVLHQFAANGHDQCVFHRLVQCSAIFHNFEDPAAELEDSLAAIALGFAGDMILDLL